MKALQDMQCRPSRTMICMQMAPAMRRGSTTILSCAWMQGSGRKSQTNTPYRLNNIGLFLLQFEAVDNTHGWRRFVWQCIMLLASCIAPPANLCCTASFFCPFLSLTCMPVARILNSASTAETGTQLLSSHSTVSLSKMDGYVVHLMSPRWTSTVADLSTVLFAGTLGTMWLCTTTLGTCVSRPATR